MPTRDLHNNVSMDQLLAAQAVTTTQTSSSEDLQGYDSAEFFIAIGTVTNIANSPQPSWAVKLQDSDDDSTFADVTNSDYVLTGASQSPVAAPDSSTGVFLTVDAAAEDAEIYRVGYCGPKRYCRVVATAANTPGSTPMAIWVVKGHAHLTPVATDS